MNGRTGTARAGLPPGLPGGTSTAASARPVPAGGRRRRPGTGLAWPLFSGLGPMGALSTAPRLARAFTTMILASWDLAAVEDTTVLIVSELTTNVVRAAQDEDGRPAYTSDGGLPVLWLRLMTDGALLGIEVWDTLPAAVGGPSPRQADPDAESGRGLGIVEALSLDWGWDRFPGTDKKCTWAVLKIR